MAMERRAGYAPNVRRDEQAFSGRRVAVQTKARDIGWWLFVALGFPALVLCAAMGAEALVLWLTPHSPMLQRMLESPVVDYTLPALPLVLVFWVLGLLARRLGVDRGMRFLGFVWSVAFVVVTALLMSTSYGFSEGAVSALFQGEAWLFAGFGWWLATRKSAGSSPVGSGTETLVRGTPWAPVLVGVGLVVLVAVTYLYLR
jgi:hypothetical protein